MNPCDTVSASHKISEVMLNAGVFRGSLSAVILSLQKAISPHRSFVTWSAFYFFFFFLFSASGLLYAGRCFAGEQTVITSDTLEYHKDTASYLARGHVKIQQGDAVIEALEIRYNEQTSEVVATGDVIYNDSKTSIRAARIEMNLESGTGTIFDAQILYKKDNYHVSGREIRKLGDKYYFSPEATFTTCDGPVPAWCFHGKDIDAVIGDRLKAKDVSFRIMDIPVLYAPYLWAPLLTERKSGILMPVIGYSNSRGLHLNIPLYWAISENRDATFILDEYTKRGLGEGLEYRYIEPGNIKGKWWLYHLRDNELHKNFVEFRAFHNQHSADGPGGYINVNLINEKDYYREFVNDIRIRTHRFLDSTGEVTVPFSNSRVYLLSQYWIDLKTGSLDPAHKLPEAGFVLNPTRTGHFLVSATTAFTNFWRDEGILGQRADIYPQISYSFGEDISVLQTLGLRETAYSLSRGDKNSLHRESLEYRITGHSRVSKRYGPYTHIVEPSISYTFISNSENSLPIFDSAEQMQKTSRIEIAFLNRLFSDKGEFLVFRISEGFDSYLGDRPFLPLKLEIGMRRPVAMRLDSEYNVHTGRLENINSDIRLDFSNISLTAGQRYSRSDNINTFVAGIGIHPYKPLFIDSRFWYDAEENETRDIALNIKYIRQCWGVNLGFVKRPGDFSVTVLFELKGITRALKI